MAVARVQSLIGGTEILEAVQCGQKRTQIQPKGREKSEQPVSKADEPKGQAMPEEGPAGQGEPPYSDNL